MKKRIGIFVLLIVVLSINFAVAAVPWSSVCRVTSGENVGTGICFLESGNNSYVVTNAHVITPEGSQTANAVAALQFFTNGHESAKAQAAVLSAHQDYDIAVMSVKTSGWPVRPTPIPFKFDVSDGDPIYVLGCAEGAWPTMFEGRKLTGTEGGLIPFFPAPKGGRSGGPLLSANGVNVLGVVTYRVEQKHAVDPVGSYGLAVPAGTVVSVLRGGSPTSQKIALEAIETQYAESPCGPYGCPPTTPPNLQFGLINRNDQAIEQPGQIPIYPTLPPTQTPAMPIPTSPQTDAAVLARLQSLEANVNALAGMSGRMTAIEEKLGIVSDEASQAADAAAEASDAANTGSSSAIAKATGALKSWVLGKLGWVIGGGSIAGLMGFGSILLILFVSLRFIYKKLKSQMDTNGDGVVSKEELKAWLFSIADRNDDGVINAKDFINAITLGKFGN